MVTSLGLLLGACSVGAVDGAGGGVDAPPDPNAASFNAEIKPRVQRCVDAGCHHTGGIQPSPNFDSITTLQSKYKTGAGTANILVTHVPDGAQHGSGATLVNYFDAAEKTAVAAWIDSIQ
jgi:hypothetical protein